MNELLKTKGMFSRTDENIEVCMREAKEGGKQISPEHMETIC